MAKKSQSKYASIVPGLPELPVEAEWQQRLDGAKAKILDDHHGAISPQQLMVLYRELRRRQDELKQQLSEVHLGLEAATQMLCDSNKRQESGWGAYGTTSNTLLLASGDRLRIDIEPYISIVDKDANRIWAIRQGMERMLSLPWSTVNMITKQMLLNGEPEPPGVKTFKKATIVFTPMKQDTIEEWTPDTTPETEVF